MSEDLRSGMRRTLWSAICAVLLLAVGFSGAGHAATYRAYVDPTNGDVPEPREERIDTDRTRKHAFPSARGYGRFADPGIGPRETFKIYKITHLGDSGAGSFRDCYMATVPRVCIFTVSGTITVQSDMLARAPQSRMYIAGQTSPGGIQLKVGPSNSSGPLRSVTTSDFIMRFIRLRPGTGHQVSTNVQGAAVAGNLDWSAHDVILDHVSQQWATDEGFAMIGLDNATLQWSLQSEPIACGSCRDDHNSSHDYGSFLISNNRFTMYKNVLMGGRLRNPNIAANSLDMINNVVYNYGEYAAQMYVNVKVSVVANILSNWFSRGPRTGTMSETGRRPHCLFAAFEGAPAPGLGFEFYLNGNVCPDDLTGANNLKTVGGSLTSPILYQKGTLLRPSGAPGVLFSSPRHGGISVRPYDIVSAQQAVADVLAYAGAMRNMHRTPNRDAVDSRSINQLTNCDDRSYVPQPVQLVAVPSTGYPQLETGGTWSWAGDDTDNDGMLDSWERSHPAITSLSQLRPNGDFDSDGWSDLEEFLNYLAGDGVRRNRIGRLANVPAAYCGYPVP
ncbi:MAG: hypothetical protein ACKVP5_13300 [Aestuariivirga sp.]